METMTTEELTKKIVRKLWTYINLPESWNGRKKAHDEVTKRVMDELGKGKFVQSDQDFWIVTKEDLREWTELDDELPPQWKECAESLIRHLTNGEIQSIDDLGEDEEDGKCRWRYDQEYDKYETECGGLFQFTTFSKPENNFNYCPECGNEYKVADHGGK